MDLFVEPAPLAGRPPAVPDGIRLYVIGDVHGRLDLLRDIERQIEADVGSGRDGLGRRLLGASGDPARGAINPWEGRYEPK